ncbi:MAG: hypothetical protein NT080_10740 [Spirochaetes bacterium]|nr:hypothetical protein [Spirochaetota bacterium]
MTIQIFGTPKSADTRKAERFFKERDVPYQFRDVREKPPSKGELEKLAAILGANALIDRESRAWRDGGYAHREFDPLEELLEKPELLATPIVRSADDAVARHDPRGWERIIGKLVRVAPPFARSGPPAMLAAGRHPE